VKRLFRIVFFLLLAGRLAAQKPAAGSVAGSILDHAAGRPAGFASVLLKKAGSGEPVRSTVADSRGVFALEGVPFGAYRAGFGPLGAENQETPEFTVDAQHRSVNLGQLIIGDPAIKLDKLEVNARRETFANSIDRKVYNVGKEIQGATGSASDLLQNVPSVDVDIEGNVSLRGNENVLVLIDGKPSTLMSTANRATSRRVCPTIPGPTACLAETHYETVCSRAAGCSTIDCL